MARQRDHLPPSDDTPEALDAADDTPEPAPEAKAPDDVLVFISMLGPLVTHWNVHDPSAKPVGGVVIPAQARSRQEPGLSFCKGSDWPHVKGSPAWKGRQERGVIRAVAGQGGDLLAEWAKAKPAVLVPMLAKSYHIPALERLREMEASLPRPRLEVAEAIDAQLAEMGAKVEQHRAARKTQRRGHRKPGQVLG